MDGGTSPNRLTWSTMVFAFIGSVVMYAVLAYVLDTSGGRRLSEVKDEIRLPLALLGIVCLIASVLWAQLRLRVHTDYSPSTSELVPPRVYITHTAIALAFAEACAIAGLLLFFLGASFGEFLAFGVPSVAVMVLVVLPKGAAYWLAWEHRQEE